MRDWVRGGWSRDLKSRDLKSRDHRSKPHSTNPRPETPISGPFSRSKTELRIIWRRNDIIWTLTSTVRRSHNMPMEMYIPEPKQSLAELKTLTNVVHDFLLEATDHVLPYFHRRGLAVDRTVSSDMFRFELSRQLKGNCQVTDQNYQDLTVKKLSNNGIECRFAGWAIKVFRGTELHPPGYSNSRLSFFRQERFFNYSMIPDLFPDEATPIRPNIVILWEFSENYTTLKLRLALPCYVHTRWSPVECYWTVDVPERDTENSGQPPRTTNFPETYDSIDDPNTAEPEIQEPDIRWKEPQEQEDIDNGEINGTGTNPREPS